MENPGNKYCKQIVYILISNIPKQLLIVKTRPGAERNSDYVQVIAKLRINLKKLNRAPRNIRLDF